METREKETGRTGGRAWRSKLCDGEKSDIRGVRYHGRSLSVCAVPFLRNEYESKVEALKATLKAALNTPAFLLSLLST